MRINSLGLTSISRNYLLKIREGKLFLLIETSVKEWQVS